MFKMRSFQLFRYSPPKKTVADYSEAEKEQFRVAFKPIATRYRIFGYFFLSLCFVVFAPIVFFKQDKWLWVFVSVIACVFLYSLFFAPACPACELSVDDRIRTFCPECGGKVSPGGFFKAPQCLSCGKDLWWGKRRSYKIRCCTHCGVFPDCKGI